MLMMHIWLRGEAAGTYPKSHSSFFGKTYSNSPKQQPFCTKKYLICTKYYLPDFLPKKTPRDRKTYQQVPQSYQTHPKIVPKNLPILTRPSPFLSTDKIHNYPHFLTKISPNLAKKKPCTPQTLGRPCQTPSEESYQKASQFLPKNNPKPYEPSSHFF